VKEPDKSILAAFDAYKTAVFAKDAEAFAALYDPEVRVFDLWGAWSHDGLPAWRGMAAEWFRSLGAERVAVDFTDVRSAVAGDVAVAHAFVAYKRVSAEGRELHGMRNRITWALRRSGGAWKVIHEHTSAPIDLETSKVILQG
jgi:uncharacterized protein (TIGR02246 family)